ncbi:hypothetical protein ABTE70_10360 [Acinetobacter baumannii]
MAVPEQTPFIEYTANGTTTVYPLTFDCDKSEYLIVSLDGEEAPVGSWTLTGGSITFNSAPANGVLITIERNTPFRRTTEYQSYNNSFRPSPVNKDFDLIWWKLQELGYRDQVIWLALVKEIADRIAGDDNLQNQINTIDEWLDNLQQNVNENTSDIAQLVTDLSKEIADRIANDEALKEMFLAMMDEAINEGTINALAITHVDTLEGLDAISNVWDGRTIYVKDLGNYCYDALTTSWVKAYQDADNVKDGAETQKQINAAQRLLNSKFIQIIESVDALRQFKPKQDGQAVYLESHAIGKNKGGGIFLYSATSTALDNNGTIISCVDGGAFLRQYDTKNGYFEWFGAQCDGVTDDTASVIAALKVLKVIHFSNKVKITHPIDVDQFKTGNTLGLKIEGNGTESSYIDFVGCDKGFYSATNAFFRDFTLKSLKINNVDNDKTGLGVYIGSGGAEQVNFESVSYSGWLIGRATHTWNSSFKTEVFRNCKYPFTHYGTSSNIENPYALNCSSPYMFGYASDINGNITIPSIPFAYSELSGFAADDCGADGAIYKFGRCSGITINSPSCERVKGLHVFDLYDLVGSAMTSVVVNNFSMYIPVAENPNLTTLIKKPNALFGAAIFNDLRVSTDKEITLVSDDGSGVILNNVKTNDRAFTKITQVNSKIMLDGVSWGGDTSFSGEVGVVVGANNISYTRVKNKKGKVLIDPTTQKLCIYGGALSEGLAQGLMLVANITVNPLNKGGNNANEKAGIILMSSAMDFNASNMGGHLKTVLTGTLTTLTTVTRNTENTTHLQFDVVIEATSATTRYLLDIDLTFNGISNINRLAWQVVAK